VATVDFSVVAEVADGIGVVTASGEIDVATAEPLRQALISVEQEGATQVVVDLTEVEFLDSTGLGVLVGSLRRLRDVGGDMYVAMTHPHLLKVMRVTNLDRVFRIVDTADRARDEARAAAEA
jgi:anti-sigma B factor antagonist